ncbi:DNA topoisomerase-1 [Stackebrandtia albiflava]|uniref:DNA topoisomerase n=1 Tax=Stackebrandtia albiflava TaxID=406432 RepID=A0A562VDT0_9ACTN|nr:DNA topoisomerase IB [Stackebrandtia albiflava]TWJ15971.1 DNA topoisomerase-1 [Stackebrandtia albiflava]
MELRRSDPSEPGITRRRYGRGFRYRDADGSTLDDAAALARIEDLVIPPAWRRVWICAYPEGHIQAVGRDSKGRLQYIYHPQWREERDEAKFARMSGFAKALPALRRRLDADVAARGPGRDRVLAAALLLLDAIALRPGNEEYTDDNGSFGLATLRDSHVVLSGEEVRLEFPAKGGGVGRYRVADGRIVRVFRAVRRAGNPTGRALAYRADDGWHAVHADAINSRLKELTGEDFTAKDFRTWNATVLAAVALGEASGDGDPGEAVKVALRRVADALGDTVAVARDSYVDPRVVAAFESGRTIAATLRRCSRAAMSPGERREAIERAVGRLVARRRRD